MNDSERWADAFRQAWEAEAAYDHRNRPVGGGGGGAGGGGGGGGIGNLTGWVCFAGMIGALLGGVLGQGVGGAVMGALLLAGLVGIPVALLRPGGDSGISRTSVLIWTAGGAVAGLVVGVVFALAWDIVFLEDVVGSAVVGFGLLGTLGMGGWRLRQRG